MSSIRNSFYYISCSYHPFNIYYLKLFVPKILQIKKASESFHDSPQREHGMGNELNNDEGTCISVRS